MAEAARGRLVADPWPFDADRDDPLTALRIPAVASFNPMWRYVAAYVRPREGESPPFASVERPTDTEARMLASFIREYIERWFNERYQEVLAGRLLDVDSGCNTTVFIKYGEDDWGYRMTSWQHGPTFVPGPPGSPSRGPMGRMSLERVMDRRHTIGDDETPMSSWLDWKARHPDVFGAAPASGSP